MTIFGRRASRSVAPFTGAWIEIPVAARAPAASQSHPSRVRGLKWKSSERPGRKWPSHPSRVRGLKSGDCLPDDQPPAVAPFTGAWIEIAHSCHRVARRWSHPSRVRGLKSCRSSRAPGGRASHPSRVRGLKSPLKPGCGRTVRSHPSRVRGLKFSVNPHHVDE